MPLMFRTRVSEQEHLVENKSKVRRYLLVIFLHSFSPFALRLTFIANTRLACYLFGIIIFYFPQVQIRKHLYPQTKLYLGLSYPLSVIPQFLYIVLSLRYFVPFPTFLQAFPFRPSLSV